MRLFEISSSYVSNLVLELHSVANFAAYTEVVIDWADLKVQQAPSMLPPVFNNELYLVYALTNAQSFPETGKITIFLAFNLFKRLLGCLQPHKIAKKLSSQ